MAKVHITNVVVLDNPSSFFNPFQFELTFECIEELREDLEWKMIYVGSAESESYDQVLDTIYVGPVPEGRHIFVFQADPPDVTRIPENDAVGVTIILLTCSYRGQEFVRVGYFINNEYSDPELKEMPPAKPQFDKLQRNILDTKPRVTRFKINWDDGTTSSSAAAAATMNGVGASTSGAAATTNGGGGLDESVDHAELTGACQSARATPNDDSWATLGGLDGAAGDGGAHTMEDDAAGGDVVRINENSNSLAMEC